MLLSVEGSCVVLELNGVRNTYHVASSSDQLVSSDSPNARALAARRAHARAEEQSEQLWVHASHLGAHALEKQSRFRRAGAGTGSAGTALITAPMPCKILQVCVQPGQVSDFFI